MLTVAGILMIWQEKNMKQLLIIPNPVVFKSSPLLPLSIQRKIDAVNLTVLMNAMAASGGGVSRDQLYKCNQKLILKGIPPSGVWPFKVRCLQN